MKKIILNKYTLLLFVSFVLASCGKDFLELEPRGTSLETNFYKTEDELFQALVATYDVLQWGGTDGWTMKMGLLNAASDDCYAGGSDASDQPSWVAYDKFTLDPFIGPQSGLWKKDIPVFIVLTCFWKNWTRQTEYQMNSRRVRRQRPSSSEHFTISTSFAFLEIFH